LGGCGRRCGFEVEDHIHGFVVEDDEVRETGEVEIVFDILFGNFNEKLMAFVL
jgi:hypothetical protein